MNNDIEDSKFEEALGEIPDSISADEKVCRLLAHMKQALTDPVKPRFRIFWKLKKVCLDEFKKDIHPTKRSLLWKEYTDLLNEAHQLQGLFEKESEFNLEQIRLAISSLHKDVQKEGYEKLALKSFEVLSHPQEMRKAQSKAVHYEAFKQRIFALKKELIGMEIRIGLKNKVLDELSKIADDVFPVRKECMQRLTESFTHDLEAFFTEHFDFANEALISSTHPKVLRSKIMAFQSVLKEILILNDAYKKLRKKLSSSWDVLQKCEKEKSLELDQEADAQIAQIDEQLKEVLEVKDAHSRSLKARELFSELRRANLSPKAFGHAKKQISQIEREVDDLRAVQLEEKRADEEKRLQEELQMVLDSIESLKKLKATSRNIPTIVGGAAEVKIPDHIPLQAKTQYKHYLLRAKTFLLKKELVSVDELEEAYEIHIKGIHDALPKCGLDIELALELGEMLEEDKKQLLAIRSQKATCQ